jgi:hypothetical protein
MPGRLIRAGHNGRRVSWNPRRDGWPSP